ncbi:MAG: aminotransferase class I/II-fold pyridoxal phosphate-dependent enzyme [Cellvibrionaceae bacterium]|nr:aminotransferase class I/II-fold pyridoxal phosphate-dependent enzyme [Cellvibrionaceae bacterium]
MRIIKPHIMAMSAYQPPLDGRDANRHTLLDFNERTLPVIAPIKQALHDFLAADKLQQYPAYGAIMQPLADYAGVTPEQLMITNGSDQGIDLVFRAVATPGAEAIIPGPSFAMYTQCAQVEAMKIIAPQYTRKAGYPLAEVLAAISAKTAIIVVANPNNPSGTSIANQDIVTIAQAAPGAAILVDECYYEYTKDSLVGHLNDLPNVFITRTFSKTWGIPSLRFGYLMAQPAFIRALCNLRGPYDINQLAVVAASAALKHSDAIASYVVEIMTQAKPLLESFLDEQGIDYWTSHANYLWTFPADALVLNQHFAERGFLLRPKAYQQTMGLRISIGTVEQMQKLLCVWRQYLAI